MLTLLQTLHITDWRDIVELITLTGIIYTLSAWLKKDGTRPLLALFYGYCLLIFISTGLSLTTLSTVLILAAPCVALLALFAHQDTLQRRLVLYRNKKTSSLVFDDWLETIMRFGLIAINQGKEWCIVIEHHHELETVMQCSAKLAIPVNEELLSLITTSTRYQAPLFLWIKSNGTFQGINAQWRLLPSMEFDFDRTNKNLAAWKQDALLMTLKTDAIVCKAMPDRRTFDVVIAGKMFEQITAAQALALMKKHLLSPAHPEPVEGSYKGLSYEKNSTTHSEQRSS